MNEDLEIFSNNKNADSYRVINTELARSGLDWWRADVVFNLLDDEGDVILNKDGCYFLEGNIGVTISCDVDKNPMNKQKKYLDFGSGMAVNSLGHCHPILIKAIKEQSKRLWHTSNLYYSEAQEEYAALLCKYSFAEKVFFTNSPTEKKSRVFFSLQTCLSSILLPFLRANI